ncbi:hypothetical protein [Polyangium jinanense]|uniref:Lipoprotein n=1 Tax=Polyangium jinanense TaxID=2829994 RepID=A0A9X3X3H4_9BACT|nr:hypothetical protein [Polyangium jinanense]MDC3957994.1 hypothetical protein [Polyangium jinanense]MDC3983547.1 hypothetical protein [Polyangium jinanense]
MRTSLRHLPSTSQRAATILARFAAAACLAATFVACGPPPEPAKPPESAEERAEKSKIENAKKLIEKADEAYNAKDFDEARKLLGQAKDLNVESLSFQITEQLEKVDKRHAKLWANEVEPSLKDGDCKGAFGEIAGPMRDLESDVFVRELRRLIGAQALACVQSRIDEATTAGKYAAARTLVASEDTKTVLGGAAQKKLVTEVDTTIFEAKKAELDEPLKAKRWADAIAKIDEAQKNGDIGDEGAKGLLGVVRAAITPEIAGMAARAVGQGREALKALEDVDKLIKLARWEIVGPDMAPVAKDKTAPEVVAKKRQALAVWVEAQRVKMKPGKKAEKRWAHGKVAVLPAAKSDAPSKRDLAPATEVWILGQTKDLALVTDVDPAGASLDVQLERAVGWAPLARLAPKNTTEWIPPDDQLVGTRVWAPLRQGEANLELGIVSAVKGQDVTVKRLADDKEIQVKRGTLRLGRLLPGAKLVAFCQAKTQIVTLEEILPDQRTVKLVCEGGLRKDEVLPGLRARPEDLPAPK